MKALRVLTLASVGYLVVFGTLLVCLALVIAACWLAVSKPRKSTIELAIGVSVASFGLSRVVFKTMKLPAYGTPEGGFELTPANAPGLFETLQALEVDAGVSPMERVVLEENHNAAMAQYPAWGPFGSRNFLYLGLPLLLSLNEAQATSVLAHELGHASRHHSRVYALVYRQRSRWMALRNALEQSDEFPRTGWVLRKFLGWYAPLFYEETFAVSRAQEFEADAFAARHTSPEETAGALCAVRTSGYQFRRVRRMLDHPRRNQVDEPPALWSALAPALKETHPRAADVLDHALTQEPEPNGTHPVLARRLEALGQKPIAPQGVEVSAAEAWFGPHFAEILDELSARYQLRAGEEWRRVRASMHAAEVEIERLTSVDAEELDADQLLELGGYFEEAERDEEAIDTYRRLLERGQDSALVLSRLGRALVYTGKVEGIDFLDRAIELDASFASSAVGNASEFLERSGNGEKLAAWKKKAAALEADREAAEHEQAHLNVNDTFVATTMPAEQRAKLAAWVERHPQIRRAYLIQRRPRFTDGDEPVLVVDTPDGVETDALWDEELPDLLGQGWTLPLHGADWAQAVVDGIEGSRLV